MTIPNQKPERIFDDEHGYFDFLKPKTEADWVFLGMILMGVGALIYSVVKLV
jgi:hypothetical protein